MACKVILGNVKEPYTEKCSQGMGRPIQHYLNPKPWNTEITKMTKGLVFFIQCDKNIRIQKLLCLKYCIIFSSVSRTWSGQDF